MRLPPPPGTPCPQAGTSMDHGPATQESAESPTAPVFPSLTGTARRHGPSVKPRVSVSWWLLAVLAVQTALSLRLVRADTAVEGRARGVGAPAARHSAAAVPDLLLRGAGPLPAHRRAGRQHRGPDRSPDPVPRLHAGGHRRAVGHHRSAVRAPGRALRRRGV